MSKALGNLHLKVGDAHKVIKTSDFHEYHDGFSFCVLSELEAFQAAHCYQMLRTAVRPAAQGHGWSVQVYNKP